MLTSNERLDFVLIALKGVYESVHSKRYLVMKSSGGIRFSNHKGEDLTEVVIPTPNYTSRKEGYLTVLDIFNLTNISKYSTIDDLVMILEHLVNDGFVVSEKFSDMQHYKIHFSGLHLLENGGYSGKEQLLKTERELKERQLKKADFDVKRMNTIYAIAVIGLLISSLNFIYNVTGVRPSGVLSWIGKLFNH